MAVAQGKYFVAPSLDVKTKAELNSVSLEAGLYYCTESITVSATNEQGSSESVTSSRWTVTCISTEDASSVKCLTQIWIDSASPRDKIFLRYANSDMSEYTDFSMLVTTDYLKNNVVLNTHSEPVHVVVSNSQPSAETGITKIWIDTSGS